MKSPHKTQKTGCVAHCEFRLRIAPRFLNLQYWIWATGWRYSLGRFASDEERSVREE